METSKEYFIKIYELLDDVKENLNSGAWYFNELFNNNESLLDRLIVTNILNTIIKLEGATETFKEKYQDKYDEITE